MKSSCMTVENHTRRVHWVWDSDTVMQSHLSKPATYHAGRGVKHSSRVLALEHVPVRLHEGGHEHRVASVDGNVRRVGCCVSGPEVVRRPCQCCVCHPAEQHHHKIWPIHLQKAPIQKQTLTCLTAIAPWTLVLRMYACMHILPSHCTNVQCKTEHIFPEQGASECHGNKASLKAQSVWEQVRRNHVPVKVVGRMAHAVDEGIAREVLPNRVLQNSVELCRVGRAPSQGAPNHVQSGLAVHLHPVNPTACTLSHS